MKGLIIAEPWIGMIIAGKKTWEMRSRNTTVRGRIGLVRLSSASPILSAPCRSCRDRTSKQNVAKHQVRESNIDDEFKYGTAWVLEHAQPLREAVPYRHPARLYRLNYFLREL